MKLLFTVNNATKTSKIGDSDFKKHYPSINNSFNWYNFEPYIRQATNELLLPYLGLEFYDDIQITNADEELEDIRLMIIASLKDALAYYSVYKSLPFLNMTIADMGAHQVSDQDGKVQPTSQWRYKQTRWSALIDAYKSLDRALSLMETHVNKTIMAKWKGSSFQKAAVTTWFKDTAELNQFIQINNSRRAYIVLKPYLEKAEREIKNTLCSEFYKEVIAAKGKDDNEVAIDELIDLCQHFVAERGLHLALPHLRCRIDGDGIMVITQTDGMDIKDQASDTMVRDLLDRTDKDSNMYLADIVSHLYRNVDGEGFETFKDKGYVEPVERGVVFSRDSVGGIMF